MDKLRNLPLKKTIIIYMLIFLCVGFLLSAFLIQSASYTQQEIIWKYVNEIEYMEQMQTENQIYELPIPIVKADKMTGADRRTYEICDFIETYTGLLLSVLGSCLAVILFYRNKLKPPIEELYKAADMVSKEELEFHVTYENKDELGQLCKEFERMRGQLEENNRMMWRMMEEEKALRAAIAHDIRSPLSILKGYQEMLLEFVPEETLDKEQLLSMLEEGMGQIERMNVFIETMRRMNSLEERKIRAEDIPLYSFADEIENEINILSKETGKKYEFKTDFKGTIFAGDKDLILEVMENMFSNALRYAKDKVVVSVTQTDIELAITILDDGQGFWVSPEKVTKVFYHSGSQEGFGLGLYISKLYCEKHKGKLVLGNQQNGGAIVKAVFRPIE